MDVKVTVRRLQAPLRSAWWCHVRGRIRLGEDGQWEIFDRVIEYLPWDSRGAEWAEGWADLPTGALIRVGGEAAGSPAFMSPVLVVRRGASWGMLAEGSNVWVDNASEAEAADVAAGYMTEVGAGPYKEVMPRLAAVASAVRELSRCAPLKALQALAGVSDWGGLRIERARQALEEGNIPGAYGALMAGLAWLGSALDRRAVPRVS